jgi:hypothetical protein
MDNLDCATVQIQTNGGPVTLRVADETHPQAVTGVVWRYDASQKPDGWSVGFSSSAPEVNLGAPGDIDGKLYGVIGGVVHPQPADSPPTRFEVTVTLFQGPQRLLAIVPEDGGKGTLSDKDAPFTFYFGVEAT